MIKSMQRCQNCRFFKRTWEKVEKIAGVTYYLDRRELTRSEVHSIAGEKEYRGCALDRTGMAILPEKLYELQRPVRWEEYERQERGVCRRYPPQIATLTHHTVGQWFPDVDENDYCGEWRPILVSRTISAYTEE